MILPHRTQFWGWAALGVAEALMLWQEAPALWLWGLLAFWLLILFSSAMLLYGESLAFTYSREHLTVQQSGQSFTVRLTLQSHAKRTLNLQLYDHHPPEAECASLPIKSTIAPEETLTITYPLTLNQRGRFQFTHIQLRYADRFSLWQRDFPLECPTEVRIYPRFDHSHATSTFAGIQTPQLGHVRPLHNRSGNGDFSQLRHYIAGDALNRIDHKASARHGKWLVREDEYEHQQPVILMLDASRRQQTHYHGKTLFDELLNAATQLARAALNTGDEIGVQLFSDHVQHWLPPSRHNNQYRRLVESLFDRHADNHPPDYTTALHDIYRRQRQRALIILMTTLESGDENILRPLIPLIQRRHHLMIVNIRPPWLDSGQHTQNDNMHDHALTESARILYDNAFSDTQERLRREKLIFVPAKPGTLRPQLLNAYLAYKKHLQK